MVNTKAEKELTKSEGLITKHLSSWIEYLEDEFNERKANECQDFHNKVVDIILQDRVTVQNAAWVLEQIVHELHTMKMDEIYERRAAFDDAQPPLKQNIVENSPNGAKRKTVKPTIVEVATEVASDHVHEHTSDITTG